MTVYFIAGLGADERIFKNLLLPAGCTPVYLDWIKPKAHESLSSYSMRLAAGIETSKPFALLGLSFGGMLAVEISKRFVPEKLVLISSIATSAQLPPYFKLAGKMQLQRLLPTSLFLHTSLLKRLFTTETAEQKRMLRALIKRVDPQFVDWALTAILQWKSEKSPLHLVHIQGSADLVLPLRYVAPTHVVKGGGHLMVLNRAADLNRILAGVLLPSATMEN